MNKDNQKTKRRYIAPVIVTCIVVLLVCGFIAGIVYVMTQGITGSGFFLYLGLYLVVSVFIVIGILWCLRQRINEINKGEEDEARKY